MESDGNVTPELYGWETLARTPHRVVICEGEFDRLVLEARGFEAVTSTAGAQTFRPEWALAFAGIRHIFICFDHDEAGETAARHVKSMLPAAKIVRLPADVGAKGDITDYFIRLGYGSADFEIRLADAAAEAEPAHAEAALLRSTKPPPASRPHLRAERLKQAIRLVQIVGRVVDLQNVGGRFVGRCPFHEDDRPSFTIYPETNTYHCFGCGEHGDIITFVMRKESKTYHEALDALERFHLTDEL
jgi:DNA primase